MNRNITCFFKGDFNNSLIGKNIKAMGIIEEKNLNPIIILYFQEQRFWKFVNRKVLNTSCPLN